MRVFLIILAVLALAGCATRASRLTGASDPAPSTVAGASAGAAVSSARPTGMPQLVVPVSGGAMLVALPLGSSLFLPLDGGAPVTGLAVSP